MHIISWMVLFIAGMVQYINAANHPCIILHHPCTGKHYIHTGKHHPHIKLIQLCYKYCYLHSADGILCNKYGQLYDINSYFCRKQSNYEKDNERRSREPAHQRQGKSQLPSFNDSEYETGRYTGGGAGRHLVEERCFSFGEVHSEASQQTQIYLQENRERAGLVSNEGEINVSGLTQERHCEPALGRSNLPENFCGIASGETPSQWRILLCKSYVWNKFLRRYYLIEGTYFPIPYTSAVCIWTSKILIFSVWSLTILLAPLYQKRQ